MEVFNIGSFENDGTGTKLRNAFSGVNRNFNTLDTNKADLVGGKVPLTQLPTKVISLSAPSGIPANGDEWIIYSAT